MVMDDVVRALTHAIARNLRLAGHERICCQIDQTRVNLYHTHLSSTPRAPVKKSNRLRSSFGTSIKRKDRLADMAAAPNPQGHTRSGPKPARTHEPTAGRAIKTIQGCRDIRQHLRIVVSFVAVTVVVAAVVSHRRLCTKAKDSLNDAHSRTYLN